MSYEKLIFIVFFIAMNVSGVIINCADKYKAKHNKWRIKEHTLWIIGILGGATFSYITMRIIHHKTKHKSFMTIMPILCVIQVCMFIFLLVK